MINQKFGAIILVTGSPAKPHLPGASAIGVAFGAMENLVANLAFEVSPFGVRVVCLRTVANVDGRSIQDTVGIIASRLSITKDQAIDQIRPVQLAEGSSHCSGYGELSRAHCL